MLFFYHPAIFTQVTGFVKKSIYLCSVVLNLTRKKDDFRPESYNPKLGVDEPIKVSQHIGTDNDWAARKSYVLKEVFSSMGELIEENTSLRT